MVAEEEAEADLVAEVDLVAVSGAVVDTTKVLLSK